MYQNTNNHESVYFYEHPTDALLYDIILLSVWAVIENAMYGSPPVTPASIPYSKYISYAYLSINHASI